jgi:hypothetical protein
MYKTPSKHGLDRKYKPWRKGKSEHSKNRSSLKKQLRGYTRLSTQLQNGHINKTNDNSNKNEADDGDEDDVDNQALINVQQKIDTLRQEISQKQQSMQEKKHAEKAHGQRFMDRQRLTRQEKVARKLTSTTEREEWLYKLALDKVYVAHHPMDVKYMPLFKRGQRVIEFSRTLYRRAVTRKRILRDLSSSSLQHNRVAWIAADLYDRLPKEWSIQDEERVFGGSIARQNKNKQQDHPATSQDARFAVALTQQEALLKAADDIEATLKQEEEDVDEPDKRYAEKEESDRSSNSSEGSTSGEDDDPVDLLQDDNPTNKSQKTKLQQLASMKHDDNGSDSDSSGSSSSSSSSSNDSDHEEASDTIGTKLPLPSKAGGEPRVRKREQLAFGIDREHDEDDDFLVDATEEHKDVFQTSAAQKIPAWNPVRGDKSQGWQTQMQRPGEFKRQQKRRRWR